MSRLTELEILGAGFLQRWRAYGAAENSPAIYGWVSVKQEFKVPEGRQNNSSVPDGTWKFWWTKTHG
jgi:hypothetical protein